MPEPTHVPDPPARFDPPSQLDSPNPPTSPDPAVSPMPRPTETTADSPPTLVVLAAGMGSRYGGLKQIDPVGPHGEIVLDYAVHDALRAGFGRVVFVIRPDIETAFRAVVEPRLAGRLPIGYALQSLADLPAGRTIPPGRAKPWGTAHAVLACRHVVAEPFAVVNADDIYGPPAFDVMARALASLAGTRDRYALVAFQLGQTLSEHGPVSRGLCEIDAEGKLARVVECTGLEPHAGAARRPDGDTWRALPLDTPVSTNMWGFTPSLFGHLERAFARFLDQSGHDASAELLLPSEIDALIRAGAVEASVLRTDAAWLGVTHPADKPALVAGLRRLTEAGLYPERLW